MKYLAIFSFISLFALTSQGMACDKFVATGMYTVNSHQASVERAMKKQQSVDQQNAQQIDFNALPATASGVSEHSWSWD